MVGSPKTLSAMVGNEKTINPYVGHFDGYYCSLIVRESLISKQNAKAQVNHETVVCWLTF